MNFHIWRNALYNYWEQNNKNPKTIIVNRQDLEEYEAYLSIVYESGIIPIEDGDGVLKFKGVPIGYSDSLQRNEYVLEE